MKILVTGATGFVGSAFLRLALSRGHRLAGLIIPGESIPPALPAGPNLAWLRGTLEEPPWKEMATFGADACLHLAWITTPGVYLESRENERFRDTSFQFLKNLPGLGTGHIFGLGTCIEYDLSNQPLSEERTALRPATLYARCKNELRLALEAEAAAARFAFGWGRAFYLYGPGEHPSRLCSTIIRQLSRGEATLLKTPASRKDYIYVDDLAAALLVVLGKRVRGAINLGTGLGVSVREIADCLGGLMGRSELIREAARSEPDPFPMVVADATRLKALGWSSNWPLNEGLAQMVKSSGFVARGV